MAVLLGRAARRSRCGAALLEELASAVGIFYAPSALFAVAFGFVLVMLLHFSLVISRLAEQTKVLAQRLGLLQHEVDELRARLGEEAGERAAAEVERPAELDALALTALAVVIVAYESAAHLPGTLAALRPQLRDGRRAAGRRQRLADDSRRRAAARACCRLGAQRRASRAAATPARRRRRRRCCSS